jgi:hypothetical protein
MEFAKPVFLRDSPIAFRRRLIFTEAEPLRWARFPTPATVNRGYTPTGLTKSLRSGGEEILYVTSCFPQCRI